MARIRYIKCVRFYIKCVRFFEADVRCYFYDAILMNHDREMSQKYDGNQGHGEGYSVILFTG